MPISPSQVTPATLAPPRPPPGGALNLGSSAGPTAPAGAENFMVTIGQVNVDGGFPEIELQSRALAESLAGRRVSVAEIYEIAGRLERLYADQGFVLARVIVPPQRLVDGGALKLAVVDGFIERVSLEATPEPARSALAARTRALIGKRRIKLAEIERALLIAGDVPGVKLKSAIARGDQPGGVLLVIEAEQQLVTGTLSLDNRLAPSLGAWESNASLAINDALGLGEQAYVSLGTGFPIDQYGALTSPLGLAGAGFIAPIGSDGFTVNPEFTHSRTQALTLPGAPQTIGFYDRFSLRGSYPVIRDRAQTLTFDAAVEYIYQENYFTLFRQRPRSRPLRRRQSRPELAGRAALAGAGATARPGLARPRRPRCGRSGGVRSAALAPGRNARKLFKLNLDAQGFAVHVRRHTDRRQRARAGYVPRARLRLQAISPSTAPTPCRRSPAALSASTLGAVVRAELTRPFGTVGGLAPATFSPYLFAAQGWGALYSATVVETANVRAGGFGLGLRVSFDATPYAAPRPGFNSRAAIPTSPASPRATV